MFYGSDIKRLCRWGRILKRLRVLRAAWVKTVCTFWSAGCAISLLLGFSTTSTAFVMFNFTVKSYVTETLAPIILFSHDSVLLCNAGTDFLYKLFLPLSLSRVSLNLPVGFCFLLLIILVAFKFMLCCFFMSCSIVMFSTWRGAPTITNILLSCAL